LFGGVKKTTRIWEAGRWYFVLFNLVYHPPPGRTLITTTIIIIAIWKMMYVARLFKRDVFLSTNILPPCE
jgi:hypothetical protein